MFPNILNRLNLKHIWLCFGSVENSQTCKLTVKLIQKLCQKYAGSLKKLTLIVKSPLADLLPKNDPALLRQIFLHENEVVILKNLKTLSIDCESFRDEMKEILLDLVTIFPGLKQVNCSRVNILPEIWQHLVKEMTLNGEGSKWKWWEVDHFHGQYRLDHLQAVNINFQGNLSGLESARKIFENLLWSSVESLKTLSIRCTKKEFPKWSTKPKVPVLVNLEKLEIVASLDSPWVLQEFGFICGVMCPGLKVVSVRSPCRTGHSVEHFENPGQIVPNERVRTLRLEGFDWDMDVAMGEFQKYFPNLTQLHLIDCDWSAIQGIFKWKAMECIVFGRRNSHWTDNYDRFILGVESELEIMELRKSWRSGHDVENFAPAKHGLFSLEGGNIF